MNERANRRKGVGLAAILTACWMLVGVIVLLFGFTRSHHGLFVLGLVLTGTGVVAAVVFLVTDAAGTGIGRSRS